MQHIQVHNQQVQAASLSDKAREPLHDLQPQVLDYRKQQQHKTLLRLHWKGSYQVLLAINTAVKL